MEFFNTTRTWATQPEAEKLVRKILQTGIEYSAFASRYQKSLLNDTGVRLRDILDHFVVTEEFISKTKIQELGWEPDKSVIDVYKNKSGFFPPIIFGTHFKISFRVEDIEVFQKAVKSNLQIEGKRNSRYRKAMIWATKQVEFVAVERNGYDGFTMIDTHDMVIREAECWEKIFINRLRNFGTTKKGMQHTLRLAKASRRSIGKDWACALFLKAERQYWENRNYAGRVQKKRQDDAGIGWANQDHHTYDSSRRYFHYAIEILETFGFECRECFYAGADAGWGSQILEQPVLGSIVFADIDLGPEEINFDFAHTEMKPLPQLKRAGLWTELHGESMLDAGLNHLECMFDNKALRRQFTEIGISMMKPFSDFPHLYQELTVGEWWPVDPKVLQKLLRSGEITTEQAEDFMLHGAIGSHFENLERNDGYKGFNQPGIDGVLQILDPKKNLVGNYIKTVQ